ncbi:MAG: ABC transporter ATP-binding protein [Syntrophomonadaceae bacterium]|nr:ABC transporter ATP-binding protein [Syntrophomonadaceae bacterium]
MGEQAKLVEVKDLVQKFLLKRVLDGISFNLLSGEALGIFGLRGSGKTALLHILAGVERFSSGQVEVLGCDIRKNPSFRQGIGLVTQEPSLFQDLNVLENLDFIASLKNAGPPDIERVILQLELKDYLRYPVNSLEAGVYQRLSLACAILNSPRLLILDEVIKDIDIYSRHLILQGLEPFLASGGGVVCGFSNIEMSAYFNRVAWLEKGQMEILSPGEARDKWIQLLESFKKPGDWDAE